MEKRMHNQVLLEEQLGYDVIDALAQANLDLASVTLEQVKAMLVRVVRERNALPTSQYSEAGRFA